MEIFRNFKKKRIVKSLKEGDRHKDDLARNEPTRLVIQGGRHWVDDRYFAACATAIKGLMKLKLLCHSTMHNVHRLPSPKITRRQAWRRSKYFPQIQNFLICIRTQFKKKKNKQKKMKRASSLNGIHMEEKTKK